MSSSSHDLITKLEAAGVVFTRIEHEPVMTVEKQEAALSGNQGTVLKNLFLKDKKNRFYVVTAMPQTKVDLQVLSGRLGTGKGGVRFAPEEALQEVLQIQPGCVTPLVIANSSAKDVVLFLDTNIQQAQNVFLHPLVNTISLGMSPDALTAAIKALGREPLFVDLEADPKIDRDNPPDLAKYTIAPPPKPDPAAANGAPASNNNNNSSSSSSAVSTATAAPKAAASTQAQATASKKAIKTADSKAQGPSSSYQTLQRLTSVQDTTKNIFDLVSKALGKSVDELDPYTLQRLTADVESQLSGFKNAAYALGHVAGKEEVVAFAQRKFA